MPSLRERLKVLEDDLTATPIRISAYHDLPFAIFRYEPEEEYTMRREMGLLAVRLQNHGKNVVVLSLANFLWRAIEETEGIEAIVEEEKEFGFARAQQTVHTILSDPDFYPLDDMLAKEMNRHDPGNTVVFLTRAAALAPAIYQVSTLLGRMQGKTRVPGVLFYPGGLEGPTGLKFMNLKSRAPMGSYRVKIY